jgi:cation diffusion facilitator CzcD-associated flavoprotein CzcO
MSGVLGGESTGGTNTSDPVGVIGAGPSGLAAAATLRAAGLPFEVLERHSDVGGIWDMDNPGSPMYSSAHLISSRTRSALDGYPFPDHYPDYPSRAQVLAYLRAYADEHELRPHVRFGTAVRHVERLPNGGWRVQTASGLERDYRALVLATGFLWEPTRPTLPGTFAGDSYHAKYYRGPDQLRGKRVLVVGGGNSGVDIACDAAVHAKEAGISLRRGYHVVPKHVLGVPADVFAARGPHLPARAEQFVFGRLLRLLVGDLRRYGLPKPDHPVLSSHPIVSTQFLHHLSHGELRVHPDVAELDGATVRFADETKEDYDLLIYATGYRPALPYLDRDHLSWKGRRPRLYLNVFHPRYPDLFVMGLFETDGAAYPLLSLQARLITRHLLDQRDRPEQALALRKLAATDPDLRGGVRYIDSPRHATYVKNRAYLATGRRLLRRMERGRLRLKAG